MSRLHFAVLLRLRLRILAHPVDQTLVLAQEHRLVALLRYDWEMESCRMCQTVDLAESALCWQQIPCLDQDPDCADLNLVDSLMGLCDLYP